MKESEIKINNGKKENTKIKLKDSYREFKYLIDNINNQSNFKVKLIYLDLYLNVFAPKSEIIEKLDILMNTVENNKKDFINNKNELEKTKDELEKTKNELEKTKNELNKTNADLANTKNELDKTNENVNYLVDYIKTSNPNFSLKNVNSTH